ncbi:hypothetical protein NLJ89_g6389 [Agrocybe chaxingu]|uniref:ACB domain-containing protein n=1 Tax=Agrocybe chaxingu TaxID=84603 RepID=A0A9W8JWJ9_9AGAR|nr:hypothetical protein NLJ89_g6389 [Agrocybe chaxingu]
MTTQYEPSAYFHSAAAYLSSASSLKQVSSSTKLELYGLFKHLTVAPKPDVSRPSIFDMVGRAKWDAWDGAGKKAADFSIHGLALSNDVFGLTALLDGEPEIDVNALDEYGYAPIHLACDRGHIDIVQILLRRGADRNIKDPDGLTPLELAQEAGRVEIEKILVSDP